LAESEKDNRASPNQLFIHHFSAFQRMAQQERVAQGMLLP
jgi:hypothetical protein